MKLTEYRSAVGLDEVPEIRFDPEWRDLLLPVLRELDAPLPGVRSVETLVRALHGALAPVEPYALPGDLVERIESIAVGINRRTPVVAARGLPTVAERLGDAYPAGALTSCYTGDITRLGVDAIVNAANEELLGCRVPNHACIDNAIHSAAGPRLRGDCATIVQLQGSSEPAGRAKVTRGYALPAAFVLHTVGPQLRPGTEPTAEHRGQLASAYRSCLDLAAEVPAIRTIGLCAISTGVFAYPKREAARTALETVTGWLEAKPNRFDRVVFVLFSMADTALYEELLRAW